MVGLLILPVILVLWFFLFPVRFVGRRKVPDLLLDPPEVYLYSYVLHVHTQFSYDSLGKPEDLMEARDRCGIDYVIVTDHNNDHIKGFGDERLIAGREVKLNDQEGRLLGDLIEVGDIRVIAHPFSRKYRWRLEKRRDYLFELVDLKDSLLERKWRLLAYLICALLLLPILGKRRLISHFAKLIDLEGLGRRFFGEGWRNRVVGGLDHHVKLYLREVRKRILVPSYELSFLLMRNFILSKRRVSSKEEFLEALREGRGLISFTEKPALVWTEDGRIKVYSPFEKTYLVVLSEKGRRWEFLGSNLDFLPEDRGYYLVLGYTYAFRLGGFLFGLRPLFVSDLVGVL